MCHVSGRCRCRAQRCQRRAQQAAPCAANPCAAANFFSSAAANFSRRSSAVSLRWILALGPTPVLPPASAPRRPGPGAPQLADTRGVDLLCDSIRTLGPVVLLPPPALVVAGGGPPRTTPPARHAMRQDAGNVCTFAKMRTVCEAHCARLNLSGQCTADQPQPAAVGAC